MKSLLVGSLVGVVFVIACKSSSNPSSDAPKSIDAATHDAAPPDAKVFLDAPPGPGLTVKNYLEWCTVSVNGGAFTIPNQTVHPANGTVTLVAKAKSNVFEVAGNMWHHTSGDTGAGEPGAVTGTGSNTQSTATVTFSGTAACVWVCCPFANGTGCTGIAEQCP